MLVQINSISELQRLAKEQRDEVIRMIKKTKGITVKVGQGDRNIKKCD